MATKKKPPAQQWKELFGVDKIESLWNDFVKENTEWLGNIMNPKIVSPVAEGYSSPTNTPTPTPTPQSYRNPKMELFKNKNPKDYQEIASGVGLASDDELIKSLLMDIALEESGMRVNPPPNPTSTAKGAFQYLDGTAKEFGINPLSATESARATNEALDKQQLSRWWETVSNGGATQTPLKKLYTPEELNRFLKGRHKL